VVAREALGRGLGALLEGVNVAGDTELINLPVAQIRPNPQQPRQYFDPQRLQELAHSIEQQGVIQPIVVRRRADGFELMAGERRLRAAQMAGFERIPALVKKADDREALEVALLENLQREDLNPMEEARAYQRLQSVFQLRQEEVAQRVGKDRSSVANMLRLLKLPPALQADIEAGRLSMGHARALLALTSAAEQQRLRDQVIVEGLSVRDTEARVRVHKRRATAPLSKSSQLVAVEQTLHQYLGARVAIKPGRRRGKIEITYQGEEDLQRLLTLLQGASGLPLDPV
jgi:ParB family transcriptional regulator, chromosome partitioning protein